MTHCMACTWWQGRYKCRYRLDPDLTLADHSLFPQKMKATFIGFALFTAGVIATNNTIVDLGYSIYQGVHNETTGLNVWKGYVGFADCF